MARFTFPWLAFGIAVLLAMPQAKARTEISALPTKAVIVVRPKDWEPALAEWTRYREKEYVVFKIDSVASAYDLRQAILRTVAQSKVKVAGVLLCGDVEFSIANKNAPSPRIPIIPTFEIPTRVKLGAFTTPTLATDVFYGDIDDDECPDLAVGRLPAKSAVDLARMLKRSIQYEQSQSYGPWRDRIHTVAGVGGFGVIADSAIESVTRRLLSEGIPDRFQLQMTYASLSSPYCPDPARLTSSFIRKINEGGLFWVYIGHGNVHRLDDFQVGDELIPICTSEHMPQFQIQDGPPIAVMLACFTGAFDAKVDSFAEQLLSKDDGPIAVIAGSRVTMPYGLSQFSTELMDGCFNRRIETLGEIVLHAKRKIWADRNTIPSNEIKTTEEERFSKFREKQRTLVEQMAAALSPQGHSLSEERKEHVRLMNLLGDPLLRISQPIEMPINCKNEVSAGDDLVVTGNAPLAGKLIVELVLSRDRLPDGIRSVSDFRGTDEQRELMQNNYLQASNLSLVRSEQPVAPGEFQMRLSIPSNCRGRCIVRAYLYGQNDWGTGAQRLTVRRETK